MLEYYDDIILLAWEADCKGVINMPPGKGRYTIGGKGTHGCKGYPVVGGEGKVHGCHPTRGAAIRQQAAIYASENQTQKAQEALDLLKKEEMWTDSPLSFRKSAE